MNVDSFRDARNNRQEFGAQMILVDTRMSPRFDRARSQESWVMLAHDQNLGRRNLFPKKTRYIQPV